MREPEAPKATKMIAVKLESGLGNNMFQYAAARVQAMRLGAELCYFPVRDLAYYKRTFRKRLSEAIGRAVAPASRKQLAQKDIGEYFTLDGAGMASRGMRRARWACSRRSGHRAFSPQRVEREPGLNYEILDDRLAEVADRTLMTGAYQSEAYFAGYRNDVLGWFSLRPRYRTRLEKIEARLSAPPERRCCIHVRRGDQLYQDKGLAWRDSGWVLPAEYYYSVIAKLPDNLQYVVVSDDPAYAREMFRNIGNLYVSERADEAVDMHLFTRCRYNIIANSTFSWWGAWLNDLDGRKIFAPRYNMGWALEKWIPWSFEAHPGDWTYIDVLQCVGAEAAQEAS